MSIQEDYILKSVEEGYELVKVFKKTDDAEISLYSHKNTDNKLVLFTSSNQNDVAFRILKGHKCDNLPTVYDVCMGESKLLVLEEYIEGDILSERIKKEKISVSKAIDYCIDICNALNLLHSENVIHRDIKPSNVVITENDRAVLIDLQSARLISDSHDKDTENLGTVGYAAPEQYGISQSLPATDIYALGVMLNELITGTHPSIKTPKGKLGKIINKCTATQMSKRYQSVAVLKAELKRYKKFKI